MESYARASAVYRYHDPARLTSWLRVALWLDIAVSAVYFGYSIAHIAPGLGNVMLAAWATVFALSIALLLFWTYRVTANARAFGADIGFEPAGAIGWLLIPVLNLWMSFAVIEEVWRASIDAANWRDRYVPWTALYWWAAWLVASVGVVLIWLMSGGIVAKVVYFAGHIACAFLFVSVIDRIRDLQNSQSTRSRSFGALRERG